jgi:hypothetical protein
MNDPEKKDSIREDCPASCPSTGYQDVDVCIPVTLYPYGELGDITVQCLGSPVVTSGSASCPAAANEVFHFTISQKLQVEVPVTFGTTAEAGTALIDCGNCTADGTEDSEDTDSTEEETGGCNGESKQV